MFYYFFLAVCRYLGFPAGNVVSENLKVVNETTEAALDLICQHAGLSVMDCDHSGFYGSSLTCDAAENRHYIVCSYGEFVFD